MQVACLLYVPAFSVTIAVPDELVLFLLQFFIALVEEIENGMNNCYMVSILADFVY